MSKSGPCTEMDDRPLRISGLPATSYMTQHGGAVLTFGTFDGVTMAHQTVLKHVIQRAKQIHALPVAVVFRPRPSDTLGTHAPRAYFTAQDETLRLIRALEVKAGTLRFNKSLSLSRAPEFLRRLQLRVPVKELILGADTTVGRGPQGSRRGVRATAADLGFDVTYMDPFPQPNLLMAFSSKDMGLVEEILTRPYKLPAWLLADQRSTTEIESFQVTVPNLLHVPPDGHYSVIVRPAAYRGVMPPGDAWVDKAALVISSSRSQQSNAKLRLLATPGSKWDQSFVTLTFVDVLQHNDDDLLRWAKATHDGTLPLGT
jgi:FAD synthase